MSNQVKITAKNGVTVIQSANKPEFGYLRVEQTEGSVSMEGGWVKKSKPLSAILRGKYADLLALGFAEGQKISGKIIRKESLNPFKPGQEAMINPTTKEFVLCGGEKIYSDNVFTTDLKATDKLLAHDRVQVAIATSASQAEATVN